MDGHKLSWYPPCVTAAALNCSTSHHSVLCSDFSLRPSQPHFFWFQLYPVCLDYGSVCDYCIPTMWHLLWTLTMICITAQINKLHNYIDILLALEFQMISCMWNGSVAKLIHHSSILTNGLFVWLLAYFNWAIVGCQICQLLM